MGVGSSKMEKALVDLPDGEKYFGLENFGNTCYCNSVLQALYFCKPFREQLLLYAERLPREGEENLLTALADLFLQISTQKKKTGVIQPKRFVQRVKRDNELFRSYMHQDAHEFLNFLLNEAHDILEKQARERQAATRVKTHGPSSQTAPPPKTWVQKLFQGRWVNETRCLRCENVTNREETFFEWSLETEPHSSVTSCLKNFSSTEMLDGDNKFFCDSCGCLQEAQKRIRCKELPAVLCLHLKRFFINPDDGRMRKLTHRVVFPFELKVTMEAGDVQYDLFAVVVHVGGGIHHGHYVSLVKSAHTWLYFDDDQVEPIQEHMVQTTFGSSSEMGNVEHGYILLYQQRNAAGNGVSGGSIHGRNGGGMGNAMQVD